MAGNERLVQKIIPRHPQAFEEINQFGHSPLHLAISYPTCLRLMLEAGGSSILENSDFEGLTPLEEPYNKHLPLESRRNLPKRPSDRLKTT
ncbi:hypothetical protein F4823DRAFT_569402 [Ustulina deusta]|nr:hypothetical protein F4823DRAFT_569402 [Ustulina deusta]